MKCPNCFNEITEFPCPFCPSDLPEDSYGLPVGLFVGSILSDEIKRNQQKKKKIQTTLAATGVLAIVVVVIIAVFSHFTGRNTPPPIAPVVTVTTPDRPAPVFTAPEPDEPQVPEEVGDVYHPEPEAEEIEPIEEEISIDEIVEFLIDQVIEYPVYIADIELYPRMVLHIAYEDLTDEILIAFLDAFDITYTNWFTIDFGDETGYVFGGGDHTHFSYGVITEEGYINDFYYLFGFANIRDGVIEWHFWIDVPHFDTVAEYLQWATGNGLELVVLNRYFEPVEDIQSILHRDIFEHPKPIFDGATEIEIVVDDE